jgi:hypothetical protein
MKNFAHSRREWELWCQLRKYEIKLELEAVKGLRRASSFDRYSDGAAIYRITSDWGTRLMTTNLGFLS